MLICDECGEREMEMAAIRKGIWEEKDPLGQIMCCT